MIRKTLVATAVLLISTLPVLEQFPPPGIYLCTDSGGAAFGTLTLLVAGDHDFSSEVIPAARDRLRHRGQASMR